MTTFMKADIFFFVTTVAVIIFVILGSIASVYLIRILRKVDRASTKLEEGIESLEEHTDAIATKIRESFLFNLLFGRKAKMKKAKESK